jgi:hypothetical protein
MLSLTTNTGNTPDRLTTTHQESGKDSKPYLSLLSLFLAMLVSHEKLGF